MPKLADQAIFKRGRSRFWQIRWTDANGREHRRSSGTEVFSEAQEQLERLKAGSGILIQAFIARFFETYRMKPKTRTGYQTSYRAWFPYIENMLVEDLDDRVVKKFVSARTGSVKPGTIRNELAFMSSALRFAMSQEGGPKMNVVKAYDKRSLALPEKRVKFLRPTQVTNLLAAIDTPERRLLVLIAIEAGLRLNEIFNLRVHQINMTKNYILLRDSDTKTNEGRRVPISRALSRALSAHFAKHSKLHEEDYLVLNPKTKKAYVDNRPWWPEALAKAGIKDFRFHDLRHHFASMWVMRGGRLQPLGRLMGHATTQMTEKYAYLSEDDAHAEFERLDPDTV